jgi:hypothetical protein
MSAGRILGPLVVAALAGIGEIVSMCLTIVVFGELLGWWDLL